MRADDQAALDRASGSGISRRAAIGIAMKTGLATGLAPIGGGAAFAGATNDRAAIRVGLVGCGGRGVGAAVQAVEAGRACLGGAVSVTAIGDLFDEAVSDARGLLAAGIGGAFEPARVRGFSGADAFDRVIAEPIDAVILATPPCFRPAQIRAAVERGLHVYAERPLAVDGRGLASVERSGRLAAARGLSFVTSLSLRHAPAIAAAVAACGTDATPRRRRVVATEPWHGPWHRVSPTSRPAEEHRIRNWIAEAAFSGGLFLDRCFDAVDLGLALLGPLSEPSSAAAFSDAVEFHDLEGRGIRVEFSEEAHGRVAIREAGAERVVVTSEMRRRAHADGFAAAWTTFLGSIRDGRPFNDSAAACLTNRVAIMMARASDALPGIARPSPTARS